MNPKVDQYLTNIKGWKKELEKLRAIILHSDLTEELKWGVPCYIFQQSNVVILHAFKNYCAILFVKGALLSDKKKILIQQSENVQAGRQIRFTHVEEIEKMASTLKNYIAEAIELEKSGAKITFKKTADYLFVEEFESHLIENKKLKIAFDKLTPGRQKAYLLYFSAAKQSKTRLSRVLSAIPKILIGKGLNDE
jgi:uncharacterized protein YdeI (YjbR/CyaY-like superfamily)